MSVLRVVRSRFGAAALLVALVGLVLVVFPVTIRQQQMQHPPKNNNNNALSDDDHRNHLRTSSSPDRRAVGQRMGNQESMVAVSLSTNPSHSFSNNTLSSSSETLMQLPATNTTILSNSERTLQTTVQPFLSSTGELLWTKVGYRGTGTLPGSGDITTNSNCIITASKLQSSPYNVIPNDSKDDSVGLQAAIDYIRKQCSSSASYNKLSLIELPAGTIMLSKQIYLDADYLVLRGQGKDPDQSQQPFTKLEFTPGPTVRYDGIPDFDLNAMTADQNANGGWIWPGRGIFRVQTREVHASYTDAYAAAPANRRDFYEGSRNFHWKSGVVVAQFAPAGSTKIVLTGVSKFAVGDYVEVRAANSNKMYDLQGVKKEDRVCEQMRLQMFVVTKVELVSNIITIDKPLEFDLYPDFTADGSAALSCSGSSTKSKVVPLKVVRGVGLENFFMTQILQGREASEATFNYNNIAHDQAIHGIVFKWAVNSYVKNVRSYMTGSHPIVTEVAKNVQFQDNFLQGSWNKGKGGNGYFRNSKVWDSLITGNTLSQLRHLTLQWSASGNVVRKNTLSCDFNLHGGWERHNLIEQNIVNVPFEHRDGGDDSTWYPIWWGAGEHAGGWAGATGPRNVFFKNNMTKQTEQNGAYQTYKLYNSVPNRIYQIGWDRTSAQGKGWKHLAKNGFRINSWASNENVDFQWSPNQGVNSFCSFSGASLMGATGVSCGGWCMEGTLHSSGNYCCGQCGGQCGVPGCSQLPGGASQCCTSKIASANKQCSKLSDVACLVPSSVPILPLEVGAGSDSGSFWSTGDFKACLSWGAAKYEARLWDIPSGKDWVSACVETPNLSLNQQSLYSSFIDCQSLDLGVAGQWGRFFTTNDQKCMTDSNDWGVADLKKCESWGVGVYEARLFDIPSGVDWKTACKNTPLYINKESLFSSSADCNALDLGVFGQWGRFKTSSDENCMTQSNDWSVPEFKACEGFGVGMYEARLNNIDANVDWQTACRNTPIAIVHDLLEPNAQVASSTADDCARLDLGVSGQFGRFRTQSDAKCMGSWLNAHLTQCDAWEKGRYSAYLVGAGTDSANWKIGCERVPLSMNNQVLRSVNCASTIVAQYGEFVTSGDKLCRPGGNGWNNPTFETCSGDGKAIYFATTKDLWYGFDPGQDCSKLGKVTPATVNGITSGSSASPTGCGQSSDRITAFFEFGTTNGECNLSNTNVVSVPGVGGFAAWLVTSGIITLAQLAALEVGSGLWELFLDLPAERACSVRRNLGSRVLVVECVTTTVDAPGEGAEEGEIVEVDVEMEWTHILKHYGGNARSQFSSIDFPTEASLQNWIAEKANPIFRYLGRDIQSFQNGADTYTRFYGETGLAWRLESNGRYYRLAVDEMQFLLGEGLRFVLSAFPTRL